MTGMTTTDMILTSLCNKHRAMPDSKAGTQDLKAPALKEDTQTRQTNFILRTEASQGQSAPADHPSIVVMKGATFPM